MKVFISHSHSDAPVAATISKDLQERGFDVWDPDLNLLPGDNWAAEIARALEESQAMVVVLTPNSVTSSNVKREIEFALGSKNYRNRIIPVVIGGRERISTQEIPWIIRKLRMFELDDPGYRDAQIELIANEIRSYVSPSI